MCQYIPDSKVLGANMGPTWALSAPDGPHVGPMNLAIRDDFVMLSLYCYILVSELLRHCFYASAFRRRRHYVFGLSFRPSVRPKPEIPSFRSSTRPTVTILRHVRPSVHPDRFPGICLRMHGGIGLEFYMLLYLAHPQNRLVYGCGLLIFLILALFWLSETGQIWGFRAFPGERMEEMAWNFSRWCILTTFRIE